MAVTILFEELLLPDQLSNSILEELQQRAPVEQEEVGKRIAQSLKLVPIYKLAVDLICVAFHESKYRLLLVIVLPIQGLLAFSLVTLSDHRSPIVQSGPLESPIAHTSKPESYWDSGY
ncbi:MAG TPA: hypothetical protein VGK64_23860, partial [Bryobacteraceae bacterium]